MNENRRNTQGEGVVVVFLNRDEGTWEYYKGKEVKEKQRMKMLET